MRQVVVFVLVILSSMSAIAQSEEVWERTGPADTLLAVKTGCSCDLRGYKIKVIENKIEQNYNWKKEQLCNYSYEQLYNADMKFKLSIVEQLLKFENDSSVVCMKVRPYWTSLSDSLNSLQITTYPVSVDALYHINFILFGTYAGYYAPFPVLYDTVTDKEITNDINSVREVFLQYKHWIVQCKKDGFINYTFPLLNTRFRWRYGHTDVVTMMEIPVVRGPMLKSIGEPR